MRLDLGHGGQGTVQCVAGRVARAVVVRLAPAQDGPNALPHAADGLHALAPYRLKDGQHVAALNVVNPHVSEGWKGVSLQGLPPGLGVPAVAPSRQFASNTR